MVGLLLWKPPEGRKRPVVLREENLLRMRCLRAEILRGAKTPESILRRRAWIALKKLKKQGVLRVILPEGFSSVELPEGMAAESTLPLRRALAADWVRKELEKKGIHTAGARVAVAAAQLSGDVVRTVTELTLRHRYVLLDVPAGEELCRRLRREYGVSVLLAPDRGLLEEAEVLVLFDPREDLTGKNAVVIPLYDSSVPLPNLMLPPVLEQQLPRKANREQLLAALLRAGVIRPGAHLTF